VIAAGTSRWLSPPQVAEQLGIDPEKVIAWIRRGELNACNVAEIVGGRPRYRIDPAELAAFLQRRSTAPTPKPARRRKASGYTPKYFQ
jgi:excisionase family DNA binding protein